MIVAPFLLALGCAYKPWAVHSTVAAKPASPLQAPDGQALLVVLVNNAQRSGNGAYTAFERVGSDLVPVAQIDEKLAAWTIKPMKPGRHQFYVRTWTSAFCTRVDADFAPDKVYVLAFNYTEKAQVGLVGSNGNIAPRAQFVTIDGGPLYFHPFVAMNDPGARGELESHRSQVNECIAHADKNHTGGVTSHSGLDQIDFTAPK